MALKEGFRVVDLWELAKQMYCKQCKSTLDLNRTEGERHVGFASVLTIACVCGAHNIVHTSQRRYNDNGEPAYVINISAVLSMMKAKISISKLHNFFTDMHIPCHSVSLSSDHGTVSSLSSPPSPQQLTVNHQDTIEAIQTETEEVIKLEKKEAIKLEIEAAINPFTLFQQDKYVKLNSTGQQNVISCSCIINASQEMMTSVINVHNKRDVISSFTREQKLDDAEYTTRMNDADHNSKLNDADHNTRLNNANHTARLNDADYNPRLNDADHNTRLNDADHNTRLNDADHNTRLNDADHNTRLNDADHNTRLNYADHNTRLNDANHSTRLNDADHNTRLNDADHNTRLNDADHTTRLNDADHTTRLNDADHNTRLNDADHNTRLNDADHNTRLNDHNTRLNDVNHTSRLNDANHNTRLNDINHTTRLNDADHTSRLNDVNHTTRVNDANHNTRLNDVNDTSRLNDTDHTSRLNDVNHNTRLNDANHNTRLNEANHNTRLNDANHTTRLNDADYNTRLNDHNTRLNDVNHTSRLNDANHNTRLNDANHNTRLNDADHNTRLNDADHTSRLNDANHTSRLNDVNHTSRLNDVNHTSRLNDANHNTRLNDVNHTSRLNDVNHTSRLNDVNHTSRLNDVNHTIRLNDADHTTPLNDANHNTRLRRSRKVADKEMICPADSNPECCEHSDTPVMDISERDNVHNTDRTALPDIHFCLGQMKESKIKSLSSLSRKPIENSTSNDPAPVIGENGHNKPTVNSTINDPASVISGSGHNKTTEKSISNDPAPVISGSRDNDGNFFSHFSTFAESSVSMGPKIPEADGKPASLEHQTERTQQQHTNKFCCHICDFYFSRFLSLYRHQIGKHGLQYANSQKELFLAEAVAKDSGIRPVVESKRKRQMTTAIKALAAKSTKVEDFNSQGAKDNNDRSKAEKKDDCFFAVGAAAKGKGKNPISRVSSLNIHRREHTGEMSYNCGKCQQRFQTLYLLKHHIKMECQTSRQMGTKTRNKCQTHSEEIKQNKEISDTSEATHTEDSTLKGSFVSTDSLSTLTDINKDFTLKRPCIAAVATRSLQRSSIKSKYQCKVCTALLPCVRSFAQHMKQHPEVVKIHPCPECELTFKYRKDFTAHIRIVHNVCPFTCADCGLAFKQPTSLKNHQLNHSGERPFMCDICGRTFRRGYELQRHNKSHTNDRAFHCRVCGNSFLRLSHFIEHQRTHTGVRPYVCDKCGKAFSQRSGLYHHMKSHREGLGAIECAVCGKQLANQRTFQNHKCKGISKRRFGDYRDFICQKCGKNCKRRQGMSYHWKVGCKGPSQIERAREFIGKDDKGMFCKKCDKRLLNERRIVYHLKRVCGKWQQKSVNRSSAGYCGKEFSSKRQCRYHVVKHCPEKKIKLT